jgi:hypothetical protein
MFSSMASFFFSLSDGVTLLCGAASARVVGGGGLRRAVRGKREAGSCLYMPVTTKQGGGAGGVLGV